MKAIRFFLIAAMLLSAYIGVLATIIFPWLGLPLVLGVLIGLAKKRTSYTSYGTARWADAGDLARAGMLKGNGLIVGHIEGKPSKWGGIMALFERRLSAAEAVQRYLASCKRKAPRHLVKLSSSVHTAIFAPSGAGKNVSIVEPFLLTTPENCIVIDLKGENARLTAAHRSKAFNHKVVMLDPYKVITQSPATFNVLDTIDPDDPESFDQIRAIAEAIVVKEPNARDPHWSQKAEIFITGVIAAVVNVCPPDQRSLQEVASIMADKTLLSGAIQTLQKSTNHSGLLARLGNEMSISTDKELDGILSTANRSLAFLSTPAVVESTKATTDFDLSELDGERGLTLYLILPLQHLRQSGLMRLWVTALMRSVVARGVNNPRPVNVILDECAALGRLEAIEDMLTIGRGFGLKITAIFQSMAQVKKVFQEGQEGVLLSNTTQVFFAVQENETAKYVSERLGKSTEVVLSGGTGTSTSNQSSQQGQGSSSYSTSRNNNWQLNGRELLQPSEVTQLDPRIAITFAPGVPPIWTRLVRYYEGDFYESRGIGPVKAAVDAACLFLAAAMGAVWLTAAIILGVN